VRPIRPVTAAVQKALQIATPDDIVVLTGSFYTLGELDRSKVLA
jgi:folylpolyglutamate synthase/dihydropteroate synthase